MRDAAPLYINDNIFNEYISRHKSAHPVIECNNLMRNSYLIMDEDLCLLNNTNGKKEKSIPVTENFDLAIRQSGFDITSFYKRGGDWF